MISPKANLTFQWRQQSEPHTNTMFDPAAYGLKTKFIVSQAIKVLTPMSKEKKKKKKRN